MICYQTSLANISPLQLHGFFVGWPNPPSRETHYRILENSDYIVLAVDRPEASGSAGVDRVSGGAAGGVVGYITAITDHVMCAYIPFIEVLPTYQFLGIGAELMRRMLEQLGDYYMIDLVSEVKLQKGYESFGFRRAPGMVMRNFAFQSGRLEEVEDERA